MSTTPDLKAARLAYRAVNYVQDGTQQLGFLLSITNLALLISLKFGFSDYTYAILFFVGGFFMLGLFGWAYQKNFLKGLYMAGVDISIESNDYAKFKFTPKDIPLFTAYLIVLEKDDRPQAKAAAAMVREMFRQNGLAPP